MVERKQVLGFLNAVTAIRNWNFTRNHSKESGGKSFLKYIKKLLERNFEVEFYSSGIIFLLTSAGVRCLIRNARMIPEMTSASTVVAVTRMALAETNLSDTHFLCGNKIDVDVMGTNRIRETSRQRTTTRRP